MHGFSYTPFVGKKRFLEPFLLSCFRIWQVLALCLLAVGSILLFTFVCFHKRVFESYRLKACAFPAAIQKSTKEIFFGISKTISIDNDPGHYKENSPAHKFVHFLGAKIVGENFRPERCVSRYLDAMGTEAFIFADPDFGRQDCQREFSGIVDVHLDIQRVNRIVHHPLADGDPLLHGSLLQIGLPLNGPEGFSRKLGLLVHHFESFDRIEDAEGPNKYQQPSRKNVGLVPCVLRRQFCNFYGFCLALCCALAAIGLFIKGMLLMDDGSRRLGTVLVLLGLALSLCGARIELEWPDCDRTKGNVCQDIDNRTLHILDSVTQKSIDTPRFAVGQSRARIFPYEDAERMVSQNPSWVSMAACFHCSAGAPEVVRRSSFCLGQSSIRCQDGRIYALPL